MDSRRNFLRGLARTAAGARPERAQREPASDEDAPVARPRAGDDATEATGDAAGRHADAIADPGWGPDAQAAIAAASVLVLGAGGLASPVATYLAGAGVGRLGLVDDDRVRLSELHAQHLHFTPDVGVPRAHSAAVKLGFLNPEIIVEPYQVAIGTENAAALVAGQDLIVDCTDDAGVRQLANAACCAEGVPLVTAVVDRAGAALWYVQPGVTACLHCAPVAVDPSAPRAASASAGPLLGVVGSLQAMLALQILAGRAPLPPESGLAVDAGAPALRRLSAVRRRDCPVCAER